MTAEGERTIIQRALQGSDEAWSELYKDHQPQIRRQAWRWLGNKLDVDDLVQDTFLQAFQKLRLFKGQSRFATWLYQLAWRQFLMRVRQSRRVSEIKTVPLQEDGVWVARQPRSGLTHLALARAVSNLTNAMQKTFLIRMVWGYSNEETSKLLQKPVGTIKARMSRAKATLRQELSYESPTGLVKKRSQCTSQARS